MSNYNFNFDANQYSPEMTAPQLPTGLYDLAVSGTDIIENGEKGYSVAVTFTVTSGEYAGRKITDRLCTIGSNDKAQAERGASRLSAICRSTGRMNVSGASKCSELIGGACKAEVKNDGKFANIVAYFDLMGNKPAQDGNYAATATPVAVGVPQHNQYAAPAQQAPVQYAPVAPPQQAPVGNTWPAQQAPQGVPVGQPAPQAWSPPAA
jgi:hypothetical protein